MGRNKSLNNGGSFYLRTEVASNEKGEYAVYLQYTLDRKVEEKLDFSDIVRSKAGEGEGLASEKSPSASQTPQTWNFCPSCGTKLDGNFKFCPGCGQKLE